ncbi:MAG: tetratricopeptide repeat protein [Acidobacteria bacterium]|nr:tetratricopeptide repeat protein [Acidobacteriota bacterium]
MKKVMIVLAVLALFATVLTFAEKKKETPQPVVTVEQLIEQGKFQEAVDLGKNMISQGNTTAGLLVNIGVAYYKMKDYQNALSYLEQAYAKSSDPLAPDTQLQLQTLLFEATIYHEMNSDDKVVETYQKALALAPEDKQVLSNYARLLESKDPQKALEVYDKLVQIDPSSGYDAAVFAMDKSDNQRAETYLNAAKSVNPEDEQILLALVKLYLKEKKFQEAVPVLEKVIAVTTRDILKPKLLFFLASCQLETKKPMEAIATCDKILAIRSNDENALVLKAKAYREMKDLNNAAKSADAALAVNPESEEANYIRAIVAIEQKDFKKAKPLCEKVANLTQNNDRKKEVQGYLKEMKGAK